MALLSTVCGERNTKAVLHQQISSYKSLRDADKASLLQYELIGNVTHWNFLDEDLSLKDFLRDELLNVVYLGMRNN